jgi:hypothetical protein
MSGDVEIMLKKITIHLYDKYKNHLELISVVPKAGLAKHVFYPL